MAKHKGNPGYVTSEICNQRYGQLDAKVTEILGILKGKDRHDLGLVGDVQDMILLNQRDRKWVYAILTIIIIPLIFLLISHFIGR